MAAQQVHCPNCNRVIPAADINIVALLAKCAGCDSVFNLSQATIATLSLEEEPAFSRPPGITVEVDEPQRLVITRRWFELKHGIIAFFGFSMVLGLLVFSAVILFDLAEFQQPKWMLLLMPTMHWLVGLWLSYWAVAGLLNRTRIEVSDGLITVTHSPVPWKTVAPADVSQVRLVETEFSNNFLNMINLPVAPTSSVGWQSVDGGSRTLLGGIPEREARYLGQKLAEHLNVPFRRNETTFRQMTVTSFLTRLGRR